MWKTFPIIVYVALHGLHALNLKDVLGRHWFILGDLWLRQARSDFI